jgi:uncharacterized protein (TIGR02246 family)
MLHAFGKLRRASWFALAVVAMTMGSPLAAAPPTDDAEFNAFLIDVERATEAFSQGDPKPFVALLADDSDATLLGGAGGHVKGIDDIRARTSRIAARYSEGKSTTEYLSARVVGDMAYAVSIDRREILLDGGQTFVNALRTTHVFIRQGGEWRILHRHSDPAVEEQARPL